MREPGEIVVREQNDEREPDKTIGQAEDSDDDNEAIITKIFVESGNQ